MLLVRVGATGFHKIADDDDDDDDEDRKTDVGLQAISADKLVSDLNERSVGSTPTTTTPPHFFSHPHPVTLTGVRVIGSWTHADTSRINMKHLKA